MYIIFDSLMYRLGTVYNDIPAQPSTVLFWQNCDARTGCTVLPRTATFVAVWFARIAELVD